MAKPYRTETSQLARTLEWSRSVDVTDLRRALASAQLGPLTAVGSGGSLSTAFALAYFHRLTSGQIANVATPLEITTAPPNADSAYWLLSASGNNVDILAAARTLIDAEPLQVAMLIAHKKSKLQTLATKHEYTDIFVNEPPSGKDGFLATNSLLGSVAILVRAYDSSQQEAQPYWSTAALDPVIAAVDDSSELVAGWKTASEVLWSRETTVVLHGDSTSLGALDLESKFTEAAVGHAQLADFRNFAHGRHHWLAKRGDRSAVLALIGESDADLATRTLRLLPPDIPVVPIILPGSPMIASLQSLVLAIRLTQWAGEARGIDPGDPGVPDFGRKLYHLSPGARKPNVSASVGLTRHQTAAIQRKSGTSLRMLIESQNLAPWKEGLRQTLYVLQQASFGGAVLDYDGTLVDTRRRFEPPTSAVAGQLVRLLANGLFLGVATGRGKSAREALRATIPKHYWARVIIGYYNGAELGALGDDTVPAIDQTPDPRLAALHPVLRRLPGLSAPGCQIDFRRHQVTIASQNQLNEDYIWRIVRAVVAEANPALNVVRSSHSIDILTPAASKQAVVEYVRGVTGGSDVLAIGDRGAWPGNDHELLSGTHALSVDQCSIHPDRGWNLGRAGQRGVATTVYYLSCLRPSSEGCLRLDLSGS